MKEQTLTVIQETEILGKRIKIYRSAENPLFKATDVAEWIEHSKVTMMLKTIDDEEKVKVNNAYSDKRTGGNGTWFLTEDGLYEVCMQSRKPIAKQIKKEIKKYLKQIRLTGGYIPISGHDSDDVIMAKALRIAKKTIQQKDVVIEALQKENILLKPDADLANDLIKTQGWLTLKQVSDLIEIGRTTLCSILRNKKVLSKQSGYNEPMGKYIKSTYFKTVISEDERTKRVSVVTLVSPKGLKFIYRLIKKNELLDEFDTAILQEVQANA